MHPIQKSTSRRAAAAAIVLLSIVGASASLPAHADVGKTPYQIKGLASGLCVEAYYVDAQPETLYHLQPCNDAKDDQKFYLLDSDVEQEIIPQTMNQGGGARIMSAYPYDYWVYRLWYPLADASWGSNVFAPDSSTQFPGPQGTWNLWRPAPYTSYTTNQRLIQHRQTGWCLSTAYHQTTPGTKVVVGQCNTPLDVWNLVTTTFPSRP